MRYMEHFYTELIDRIALASSCVLEGLSRGALFALNWAALNPSRVACIYLDAPVCDFKSWPGGKGRAAGSKEDWQRLLRVYEFSEHEALNYRGNPIDNLSPLAAATIPIIAVYGEDDLDLPPEENVSFMYDTVLVA